MIKITENSIIINRQALSDWLDKKGPVPWDGDPNSTDDLDTDVGPEQGYKTADGTKKEFPNPSSDDTSGEQVGKDESGGHLEDEDIGEKPSGVNLFDKGPNDIGGTLQDASNGKKKIKEMRDWMKDNKFNYRNFCLFLHGIDELAGFKLSVPLIGTTAKGEPTIFQVAARFHSYWLSAKDEIARMYKNFLVAQLDEMGVKITDAKGMVLEVFDGKEIDPKNLPGGVEVGV